MLNPQASDTRPYAPIVNRLGWALVIFFFVFQTFQTILQLAFLDVMEGAGSKGEVLIYGVLSPIAYMAPFFIAGACFFLFCRNKETARPAFDAKLPAIFPLFVLAGLSINTGAAYINSLFCTAIGYTIPDELLVGGRYDDAGTVIAYMATALAPAFAEEFLFRGILYGNLRPFGRTQAILISSLAFALFHQNIGQFFYTFVCGIVLALMYEYTGSIWCSIIFHMFNNQIAVLTEALYYGVFGEAVLPLLQLWDVLVYAAGVISIVWILLYRQKQKDRTAVSPDGGYFGHTSAVAEPRDRPLSVATAFRAALTPGAIVFTSLSIMEMVSLYFIVLGYQG